MSSERTTWWGVANVVPKDSLALASVKKLLRLWARNTAPDKGILAGAADQMVSWAREIPHIPASRA